MPPGRPSKYATEAERENAYRENARRRNQKKRARAKAAKRNATQVTDTTEDVIDAASIGAVTSIPGDDCHAGEEVFYDAEEGGSTYETFLPQTGGWSILPVLEESNTPVINDGTVDTVADFDGADLDEATIGGATVDSVTAVEAGTTVGHRRHITETSPDEDTIYVRARSDADGTSDKDASVEGDTVYVQEWSGADDWATHDTQDVTSGSEYAPSVGADEDDDDDVEESEMRPDGDDEEVILSNRSTRAEYAQRWEGAACAVLVNLLREQPPACQCAEPETSPESDAQQSWTLQEVTREFSDLQVVDIETGERQKPLLPLDRGEVLQKTPYRTGEMPWRQIYLADSGAPDGTRRRVKIAKSEPRSRRIPSVTSTFDVDSFILGARCLSVFNTSISFGYYPYYMKRITQNQHVSIGGCELHRTKQLCISSGSQTFPFDCYALFPHMELGRDGEVHLTDGEQRVWVDDIILPALRTACPVNITQHHIKSFEEGRTKARVKAEYVTSRAAAVEDRTVINPRYDIPREKLRPFWAQVKEIIRCGVSNNDASLARFRGVELAIVAHGIKLTTRRDSYEDALAAFGELIEAHFDLDTDNTPHDQFWVDVAIEHVPAKDSQCVLLWKLPCLRHWGHVFEDPHTSGPLRVAAQEYNWSGTADAGSIQLETAPTNTRRLGGIALVKRYNIIKEIFATPAKGYGPFDHPQLEAIALSSENLEAWYEKNHQGSGFRAKGMREALLKQYKANKHRVSESLSASRTQVYGVREEFRVTFHLAQQAYHVTEGTGRQEPPEGSHRPFFALSAPDVIDFVRADCNRWLLGIEDLISRCGGATGGNTNGDSPKDPYRLQTEMMNMYVTAALMRVLRASISSKNPRTSNELWRDTYTLKGRVRHRRRWTWASVAQLRGLNLKDALETHGRYGLPDDMFLWETLSFKPELLNRLSFARKHGIERGFAKGGAASKLQREHHELQLIQEECRAAVAAMGEAGNYNRQMSDVLHTMQQLVVQAYLQHIFQLRKRELRDGFHNLTEHTQQGLRGLSIRHVYVMLNSNAFQSDFLDLEVDPWICSHGRPEDWANWAGILDDLFQWGDFRATPARPRWDEAPFRQRARHFYNVLSKEGGPELAETWRKQLGRRATRFLWIIPAFNNQTLSAKGGPTQPWAERATGPSAAPPLSEPERVKWLCATIRGYGREVARILRAQPHQATPETAFARAWDEDDDDDNDSYMERPIPHQAPDEDIKMLAKAINDPTAYGTLGRAEGNISFREGRNIFDVLEERGNWTGSIPVWPMDRETWMLKAERFHKRVDDRIKQSTAADADDEVEEEEDLHSDVSDTDRQGFDDAHIDFQTSHAMHEDPA